jgi:hypothetical protein
MTILDHSLSEKCTAIRKIRRIAPVGGVLSRIFATVIVLVIVVLALRHHGILEHHHLETTRI